MGAADVHEQKKQTGSFLRFFLGRFLVVNLNIIHFEASERQNLSSFFQKKAFFCHFDSSV